MRCAGYLLRVEEAQHCNGQLCEEHQRQTEGELERRKSEMEKREREGGRGERGIALILCGDAQRIGNRIKKGRENTIYLPYDTWLYNVVPA